MRKQDRETRSDGAADAVNGSARSGRKRRRWSVEEKVRIVRESFASGESVTAVAARHGIAGNRLSAWRGVVGQTRPTRICRIIRSRLRPDWSHCFAFADHRRPVAATAVG